jgi:penicillin amidase
MRPRPSLLPLLALLWAPLAACPTADPEPPVRNPLEAIPQTGGFTLPCLSAPAHVAYTELGVPHMYGESRADVACVHGFVTARDRYFQMDLVARSGLGTLSEIMGEAGLGTDVETRARGGRQIAEQMLAATSGEDLAVWQAFSDGVNAYADLVRSGQADPPPELEAVAIFLGAGDPAELMYDWTPLHVAGAASTVNYVSGFETTDIENQEKVDQLETWGLDKLDGELRHAGAVYDIWENIVPPYPVNSAPEWPTGTDDSAARDAGPRHATMRSGPRVEAGVLQRALTHARRMERRMGRRPGDDSRGSNTWAVGPELTADGVAIVAGDGHLAMTVPTFLHQIHLDTELLGGGNLHALGMTIPGLPAMGLGTNGLVAWAHTSQVSDINDYYRDLVVLGGDGRPSATLFLDEEIPITEVSESYEVSAALGGEAGSRTIPRLVSGQGRPFFSLEGDVVAGVEDETPADAAAVNVFGDWIVARDVDGDGAITAITGAATHYSEQLMYQHVHGWETARDVDEWRRAHAGMTSYSQHFAVGDADGNLLYSPFQGMPCRGYLPRDADGLPLPGAHPQLLVDGTQHPSFALRYAADGTIDPAKDDELACALTPDEYPFARNPAQGYISNSNNAVFGAADDNNLWNEDVYVGGPWYGTWRGSRIRELIEAGAGTHTVETMAAIQGDHKSRMATEFLPGMLEALDLAAAYLADGETEGAAGRMAAAYAGKQAAVDEAQGRLEAWLARGLVASSGVVTFYDPAPTAEEIEDAIAATIWNAWFPRFQDSVFDDEGLPGIFRPTGSYGRIRALKAFVDGVGPAGAPLASLNPATGESVFFDRLGTGEVETKDELVVAALVAALDYLASPFGADRSGGFDSEDQSEWIWGLKHFAHFDNFVADQIGGDDTISAVFSEIAITPETLPLAEPEPPFGDPRRGLPGFPRPGDAFAIDAAGGICSSNCSYGSGPVMRMVVALDPAGVHGINVLPGGQSADPDSPHFADQAALWLGNDASPLRFYIDDVVANATGREVFSP